MATGSVSLCPIAQFCRTCGKTNSVAVSHSWHPDNARAGDCIALLALDRHSPNTYSPLRFLRSASPSLPNLVKVREAQLAQYNYILVVGEAEKLARTVNVRTRDNVVHGMRQVKREHRLVK
jgi:hypothetical protein